MPEINVPLTLKQMKAVRPLAEQLPIRVYGSSISGEFAALALLAEQLQGVAGRDRHHALRAGGRIRRELKLAGMRQDLGRVA